MKKATSKFFFFQCRLLNYFVHGTIPRYSFFYCSFCLPLHFEISKQFFLLPIISFMKLSNNSFGLLRFSLLSLNLFSFKILLGKSLSFWWSVPPVFHILLGISLRFWWTVPPLFFSLLFFVNLVITDKRENVNNKIRKI